MHKQIGLDLQGKRTLFDTSNQAVYKGCKNIQASRHLMNYFQC